MEAKLCDMDKRKVESFSWNDDDTYGRCYARDDDIEEILYHAPCGEGDKHFVDIYYKDGTCMRNFVFADVKFKKEK